jgi:hypothetical protein
MFNAPLLQQQLDPLLYTTFVATSSELSTFVALSMQQGMLLLEYSNLESRFSLQELYLLMDTNADKAAELYLLQTYIALYLYIDKPLGLQELSW